jgi:hypothetical protein
MGVEVRQPFTHHRIEQIRLGNTLVNPAFDGLGRGTPAVGITDPNFNLVDTLVAMLEHPLVPFRVE